MSPRADVRPDIWERYWLATRQAAQRVGRDRQNIPSFTMSYRRSSLFMGRVCVLKLLLCDLLPYPAVDRLVITDSHHVLPQAAGEKASTRKRRKLNIISETIEFCCTFRAGSSEYIVHEDQKVRSRVYHCSFACSMSPSPRPTLTRNHWLSSLCTCTSPVRDIRSVTAAKAASN